MTGDRLVAGIGFRHGTPSDAIVALIRRAMLAVGGGHVLAAVATAADRASDPDIRRAAAEFGLEPCPIGADALVGVDPRVPTRSSRIERLRGIGSLAEAAALACAGEAGRLVLARIDDGRATCALAVIGGAGLDPQEPPVLKGAPSAQIATSRA